MRRALIVAVMFGVTATASAGPGQDLDLARDFFRKKDCGAAVRLLKDVLYPSERIADRDDLFEARAMLGACFVEADQRTEAKAEFEKALQLKPDEVLDALFYADPARRLFDDTKIDIENRARKDEELRELQRQREALEARLANLRVYRTSPYWVNFVPFGVGQQQNRDTLKFALFGAGQLVTLGSSAGIWFYLVNKYGIRSDQVPLADGPAVRRLQQIEIATGIAFFGLYAWSVIDALRHYEPQRRVEGGQELLEELGEKPRKPARTTRRGRAHLAPLVSPQGAGIGIGWELN